MPARWPNPADMPPAEPAASPSRSLRLLLLRGATLAEIRAAAPAGALPLLPGQALHWSALAGDTCVVLALLDGAPSYTPVRQAPMAPVGPVFYS